tara:strand:- start:14105 stop:15370 length:1266 start_codon:yes stop_codon:yes gene_type:complete
MSKILIIGAGTEQIGVITEAKKMGHFVVVSDFNPNAPGIPFADKFYEVSTTDGEGNANVARKENVDGVLTVCSETAVPTVAYVADQLHLPSFSKKTALLATNKSEMRKALNFHQVRVAPFVIASKFSHCQAFCAKENGPWVVKPVDSSGQRGTNIVDTEDQLENAFNLAVENSYTGEALIDRFVIGPEVHVTMHVIKNQVHFLAISDRITLGKENFGIAVRHISPSILEDKIEKEIKDMCIRGVQAIGLENGVATCELIIEKGTPYVMELAVRVPGGYLRDVALLQSGVDLNKTTIWTSLGDYKSFTEIVTEPIYASNSVKFISSSNLERGPKIIPFVPDYRHLLNDNIKLINFHFTGAFTIPELHSSVGRFGAIIAVGNNRKEAVINSEEVFNQIKINEKSLIEYKNYSEFNVDFKSYFN